MRNAALVTFAVGWVQAGSVGVFGEEAAVELDRALPLSEGIAGASGAEPGFALAVRVCSDKCGNRHEP
jgi:hypothetical protein